MQLNTMLIDWKKSKKLKEFGQSRRNKFAKGQEYGDINDKGMWQLMMTIFGHILLLFVYIYFNINIRERTI